MHITRFSAPFGKDDLATAWNVTFLMRGQHVLGSNENFLIFGADCSENSVKKYVKYVLQKMTFIESKTYNLNGRDINFNFAKFPNDLKMLAFLTGELSVSATFFSTFANVSTASCDDIVNGSHGPTVIAKAGTGTCSFLLFVYIFLCQS